jgi:superfamily II DNA helicase RecQ
MKSLLEHGVNACRVNIKTTIEETTEPGGVEKQEYGADMDDTVQNIASGKYSIVLCHPEALLNTAKGKELLSNDRFRKNVAAVVIDECHVLEKW